MNNNDIENKVTIIIEAYLKGVKVRPDDVPTIKAGVALITNFLQNINDIAIRHK